MYGMINKAIKGLVLDNYNEEIWRSICEKSEFYDYEFAGIKSYPDSLTYKLVESASEILSIKQPLLLEMFGEYWITYTAEKGYGNLMQITGGNFLEFVENLNMLHERLANIMPELKPPIFTSKSLSDTHIELYYKSEREGFTHMVLGLIKGLGKKFNHIINIKIASEYKEEKHNIAVFDVNWEA
jgi:hypothetical protein